MTKFFIIINTYMKNENEIERFNPDVKEGLTSEQVELRKQQHLANKTKTVVGKSVWKILLDDVFSFFNVLLMILGVLTIIAQRWSSLFFLVILFLNAGIALVEDLYARHLMKKAKILTTQYISVVRNGEETTIHPSELVLDDIMILTASDQVPADSILLEGTLSVDESLLTGESLSIRKEHGDKVFSGSYVTSGTAYVRVNKVGKDSYAEKITTEASKLKRSPSQILKTLNQLFKVIGTIVVIFGIAEVVIYLVGTDNRDWGTFSTFVGSLAGSLVSMIPAGLYLLTSVALSVGVIHLYKERTSVQDMYSIEMLARTDVLCVDKTGTITDGQMNIHTFVPYDNLTKNQIVQIVSNMLNATKDSNSTAVALRKVCNFESTAEATAVLPFSSDNKYSAVTFGAKGTYVLGAIELMNAENKQGNLLNAEQYTSKGYRVIALGHSKEKIKGETFDNQVKIIGLIILEDHIKEDAVETFKWFKENGVEIKVISGDNAQTVSEIAKSVGILNAEKYVSLEGVSDEDIPSLAENYNVFGRVTPEQKALIIKALKDQKRTVAMTGDGVNDMLALKQADCSIAMASGSAAAKNISHLVLLDSDFSKLPSVVEQGRRVINNLQRTASLFLTKTIFATVLSFFFLIASLFDASLMYPFNTNHFYIWEFFLIGIPAFFVGLEPNATEIKGNFLINILKKTLFPSICMIVMVIILFTLYLLRLNGHGYFGLILTPYGNGDYTVAYEQFIAMSVICFTVFAIVILYKVCAPFDKYRAIVFGVFAGSSLIALVVEIVRSYLGHEKAILLLVDFSTMNAPTWVITAAVIVVAVAVYLFGTYVTNVVKGENKNVQNQSES